MFFFRMTAFFFGLAFLVALLPGLLLVIGIFIFLPLLFLALLG